MSISYDLEITTTLELSEASKMLFNNVEHTIESAEDGALIIRSEGFFASVQKVVDRGGSASARIGLNPSIHIYFFNVALREDLNGFRTILEITLNWLKRTTEDVALLYYGEILLLVRQKGELIRNSDETLWIASDLKLIDLPYLTKEMPTC